MGLDADSGLWVTPTGVLGPEGWVEDSDVVYLRRNIGIERRWSLSPDSHSDAAYDRENVARMLELLVASRDTERLLPLLSWFYASSVRPLILEWGDGFNAMSVTGESGAGKTATTKVFWELFGMGSEGIDLDDSTPFTIVSSLSATNSIPTWFDEYRPSELDDSKLDSFHQSVKTTTMGGMGESGNPDRSSDSYHLHAPVLVTGEERISGTAEVRRTIYTTFQKSSTENASMKRAYAELVGGSATSADGELDILRRLRTARARPGVAPVAARVRSRGAARTLA